MSKYNCLFIVIVLLSSCDKFNDFFPPEAECKGSALKFDGINDYVRVQYPFQEYSNEITVEWWANFDTQSQIGSGLGQGEPNQNDMSTNVWLMHYDTTSQRALRFLVNNSGTWSTARASLPSGWHHWAGVADGTSVRLYMDGKQVGTTGPGITQMVSNPSSVIHFGKDVRYSSNRWMKGRIDEVRIWNTALAQPAIKTWMNKPLTVSHSNYNNLKGYWKFDEGKGTIADDASPLDVNGILEGGTSWLSETRACTNNK